MKILRAILVVIFMPWLLLLALLASASIMFFSAITARFKIGLRRVKYLWWAIGFDLRFFVGHGQVVLLHRR